MATKRKGPDPEKHAKVLVETYGPKRATDFAEQNVDNAGGVRDLLYWRKILRCLKGEAE